MGAKLEEKQGTIICQVCDKVIDIVDSTEGVKTWYGMCQDCFQEKKEESLGGKIDEGSHCI
ncbi:hypothetical protein CVD27_12035 [Neobacillus cucumis]|uniref:GapA-binding peptide SR1P n=2 Tax=Neobacillus cucumis TaxID=1740721 RepID=A0A2N5HFM8_9BACI|nr:hypothetical protein CVD27_12035 [Neobacillus cucumis]